MLPERLGAHGERGRDVLTELQVERAAVVVDAEHRGDERVHVQCLHPRLRQDRVEMASQVDANGNLAQVVSGGGVGEVHVVMAGECDADHGSDSERIPQDLVARLDVEILKCSSVGAVVNGRMRIAALVLRDAVGKADAQGQPVSQAVARLKGDRVGADVPGVELLARGRVMVLDKRVGVVERQKRFALRRDPGREELSAPGPNCEQDGG